MQTVANCKIKKRRYVLAILRQDSATQVQRNLLCVSGLNWLPGRQLGSWSIVQRKFHYEEKKSHHEGHDTDIPAMQYLISLMSYQFEECLNFQDFGETYKHYSADQT